MSNVSVESVIAELHNSYGRVIAGLTEQVAVARAENTMLRVQQQDPVEVVDADG